MKNSAPARMMTRVSHGSSTKCIALLLIAALALGPGCAQLVKQPLSDVTTEASSKLHRKAGLRIAGYTTIDSVEHSFHGRVRYVGVGDSLAFTRVRHTRPDFTMAADSIVSVSTKDATPGAQAAVGIVVIGGIAIVAAAGIGNTMDFWGN